MLTSELYFRFTFLDACMNSASVVVRRNSDTLLETCGVETASKTRKIKQALENHIIFKRTTLRLLI